MPLGYLFSVLIIAFAAATAVAGPRPAHTTPSFWGFWVTFLINELPFLALYLLVGNSVIALAQGDLFTPVGLVSLVVATAAAAGLVVLIRRAAAAGAALRQALTGYGIELPVVRTRWVRVLLLPFAARRRGVVRVGNVAYGGAGKRNLLDVHHRRDRPVGGPVLVYFHGGGFRMGHKRKGCRPMFFELAGRGWVVVSANYRLSQPFPDAHVDAKRVVAWVRAHIDEYGGDPGTILVSGSSAGAHLASMLALTSADLSFQPGFESVDTSVAAVIGFGGYYGRVAGPGSSPVDHIPEAAVIQSEARPADHPTEHSAADRVGDCGAGRAADGGVGRAGDRVGGCGGDGDASCAGDRGAGCAEDQFVGRAVMGPGVSSSARRGGVPPFLFLHGDLDSSTLIEDTRAFAARLREAGARSVILAELPGAQHSFDLFYSLRFGHVIEAVAAFGAAVQSAGMRTAVR